MIKEVKGNTKLEHYGDSFIARIPDNIIDLLVLENNQKFLISIQGESIVLAPEVKQLNTFSNWEDNGIRHKNWTGEKLKEMKESIKVGIIYLTIRLKQRFSTLFSFFLLLAQLLFHFILFYIPLLFFVLYCYFDIFLFLIFPPFFLYFFSRLFPVFKIPRKKIRSDNFLN